VAVDPAAGRIYWASYNGNKISFANLNGTGGGDVATLAATVSNPNFPALLRAPGGAGEPAVAGGSVAGSVLSCSQGSWAPDLLASLLYRAPQSFAYSWSRNGEGIAGASASSYTAFAAGDYRCAVTATNQAGSATQTSAAHTVSAAAPPGGGSAPGFGAKTHVTLKLAAGRIRVRGPLAVRVSNANAFAVTGKLSGQTTKKVAVSRKRRIKLKAKSFKVGAHATKTVKLKLPKALRKLLKRKHRLSLRLTAKVKDPAGHTRTVKKTVKPKLKKKRKRSR
jgi:hypothetical protein